MAFGFQCYDASGILTFDASWSPARFIGQIATGGNKGNLTVPEFALGSPFVLASVIPPLYPGSSSGNYTLPMNVKVVGTTLQWDWQGANGGALAAATTFVYGYVP